MQISVHVMLILVNKRVVSGPCGKRNLEKMKVGVVIASRNEEENISKTLEGLENQTLPPIEIVVVNDGSMDRTGEIARSFGCRVIDLPDVGYDKTGTPEHAKTLNVGLRFSLNRWIMS